MYTCINVCVHACASIKYRMAQIFDEGNIAEINEFLAKFFYKICLLVIANVVLATDSWVFYLLNFS